MTEEYQNIIVTNDGPIGLITLNRPKVLNALNHDLMAEVVSALAAFDQREDVNVTIITGSEKAFAAGADIKEMSSEGTVSILLGDRFATWDKLRLVKKPVIAAISGFALGGGLELAMACDIIVCSETAQIGQPEINLGIIPGAGGTQRLTRLVGKHKAMEMILTGSLLNAHDAKAYGIAAKVFPAESFLEETKKLALEIASKSTLAVQLAKEAILKAFEVSITEGLNFERKNFYMLFSSEDQKEGMQAFLEKRKPSFTGK